VKTWIQSRQRWEHKVPVMQEVEDPSTLLDQESNAAEMLLSTVREAVFHSNNLPLMTLVYSQSFHQVQYTIPS